MDDRIYSMPPPQELSGGIADPDERRASEVIVQALRERRDQVGGAAALPERDDGLTKRILDEARTRSEHIVASRSMPGASARMDAAPAIPWWLWLGWVMAIIVVVIAIRWLV